MRDSGPATMQGRNTYALVRRRCSSVAASTCSTSAFCCGVGVLGEPRAGMSSVSQSRVVVVEAVGGDARRVTDALDAGLDGLLEHAPRALDVQVAGGEPASRIAKARCTTTCASLTRPRHARLVGHVALAVLGLAPAALGGVEGPARHAHDALDRARALERVDDPKPEVASGSGHGNRETGVGHGAVLSDSGGACANRFAPDQHVDRVREHPIVAGAALNAVAALVLHLDHVVAGAAVDRVGARPAVDLVVVGDRCGCGRCRRAPRPPPCRRPRRRRRCRRRR